MKKLLSFVFAAALTAGCTSDRVKNVELDGMFAQAEAGVLAIGSIEVMASPNGQESAIVKYAEDTAWLSPGTKTHEIRILLTGSNSVARIDAIVGEICAAFARGRQSVTNAAERALGQ